MYQVIHQPSGQEINILAVLWARQIDYLRSLDKKDALVCPACEQPVRVRAGKFKRHHFAHKHLENCPFQKESPELLQARAVLYHWLTEKFGTEAVSIEKQIPASNLFRPMDCWVDTGETHCGYWIFDRRLPPAEREILQASITENNISVQWVFHVDVLKRDLAEPKTRLHLTTTERTFLQISNFDRAWQKHYEHLGGSLHYIDSNQEIFITYRDLRRVHAPQLFAGTRLETALSELLIHTQTGEFIHPGEVAQLRKRELEIEQHRQAAAHRIRLGKEFFSGRSIHTGQLNQFQNEKQSFEKIGCCRLCGETTSDWVTYYGETQECVCRNCKNQN